MKNLIGFIILNCLALLVYFIFFFQPEQEQRQEFKDFSIEDTASVDKIFISQPNGKQVLLSRKADNRWVVNNGAPARKDAVDLILTTLHDVLIRGPVSQKTFEGVVKRLATGSTKVEFYTGDPDQPEKTWYIGDATADRMGTYMLLEKDKKKSKSPYITYLLRERGFLGPRFFLDPVLWKDPVLLKLDPAKVERITVTHLHDTIPSFSIAKLGSDKFSIENTKTKQAFPLEKKKAMLYLEQFSKIFYDYIDRKTDESELDSIYSSSARHRIEIQLEDGISHLIRTYNMPVAKGAVLDGKPIDYNPERMYAYSSYMGEKLHPIVQNLTFDALVPSFENFVSSTNVEK